MAAVVCPCRYVTSAAASVALQLLLPPYGTTNVRTDSSAGPLPIMLLCSFEVSRFVSDERSLSPHGPSAGGPRSLVRVAVHQFVIRCGADQSACETLSWVAPQLQPRVHFVWLPFYSSHSWLRLPGDITSMPNVWVDVRQCAAQFRSREAPDRIGVGNHKLD